MFQRLKLWLSHWSAVVFFGLVIAWFSFAVFGLLNMGAGHLEKNVPDWAISFDPLPNVGGSWIVLAVTLLSMRGVHVWLRDHPKDQKPNRPAAEREDAVLEIAEKVAQRLSDDTRRQLLMQIIEYKRGQLSGADLFNATANAMLVAEVDRVYDKDK